MNLSKFSDYAFRILIYLAKNQDKICTVEELASKLEISEHHLKKIVHRLGKTEYVISTKGRNGGLKLGMPPKDINLGNILIITEDSINLDECFSSGKDSCAPSSKCKLKHILHSSIKSFIDEISKYTLQDII
ncbi:MULTISPECIES: RrF2 family transcriptional regulator [Clostridium]|jgi:Rrf2 family nitric oxide-sensitive transcriptional repressor|uniref:HTH-type transcriptional regulator NsrR n=1 Tax=Clostridium saccharoperbutylacetonicum N1-4(HMT) TaxID=931276 RepID=M1LVD5_9CLOT|nr:MULTISPECIES: Rrf2 family transcriptional regulator [Clostridium]AGF57095.1 transcriptional regulator, BadM/Rrf2 family [Clostridium saccharoperbutylacetonicum N1-4(HMT)]AQR95785.1 HTH-type transcriptional repressor NsrR [Clostridium saccharoperbutylacetonicum]NRT62145.1 Rrf2 family nitric oxide-sensitive transcriptional repressor [Clostridium saccharoperbutylacetonicum]NSB25475.1 Rrf2 family nitric oxide-sensitive transcriptional repressor [Clostridium saccharoperbutylacetonicum]NSB31648.1